MVATPREALDRTPWLRQVPAATLDRLAQQSVLHRVPAGSILFEQSETPAFAQLLVAGRVDLLAVNGTDRALIETIQPVDLLLPAAVLNRQPYLARAGVVVEAQLVLMHADTFRDAVAADHALCLAVLACQAAQFRRQVKLTKNLKLPYGRRAGRLLSDLAPAGSRPAGAGSAAARKATDCLAARHDPGNVFADLAALPRYGLSVAGDIIEVVDIEAVRAQFPFDPLIDGPEMITPLSVNAI